MGPWIRSLVPHSVPLQVLVLSALCLPLMADDQGGPPAPQHSIQIMGVHLKTLRAAIEDLVSTFGPRYPKGPDFLARLTRYGKDLAEFGGGSSGGPEETARRASDLAAGMALLEREALLANPLLDFDRLLVVKRAPGQLGLPQNWQGNCALPRNDYDNEIAVLSPVRPEGRLATLYKPEEGRFVGDVDLDFDAAAMLFSMPGSGNRWQIWEIRADGSGLRQVTRGLEPDVDNYDACYRPDGRIIYGSTACFQGVPCVGGGNTVANLFLMDRNGANARQLCFDQDHDWCPAVMNDGRILYTRWEYSDTPHYFSRILFRMNPDGTAQTALYGSNSYWPNSIFYARPIPDHPSKIIAVISGHHGVPRMGELVLFDTALGSREADGAVQRIPGQGHRVEPLIRDGLVDGSWPRFLHPYPLGEKHFLVSCQPTAESAWGIYLVDTFDNRVLIREEPGYALLEPVPLRAVRRPPVISDGVNLADREATVYLSDVYRGEGLQGVPRGTVKSLRVYEVHYCYPNMGGHINIGVEGPWDVHRILGTVPVDSDGSATFKVPANTPISIQPLDAQGMALQLLRSWFTAMPGEHLSCVGCHERLNDAPVARPSVARVPHPIAPWHGPARGFGFKREVQPVLDRFCVGCHDGRDRPEDSMVPDFRARPQNGWGNFTPSYLALHPYVRRPGPESDYHLLAPLEFHADTSELIQMLRKGHHNVRLDGEAWERLFTWIDLNVPDHGTWGEHQGIQANFRQRRLDMRMQYANCPQDPEVIPEVPRDPVEFSMPAPQEKAAGPLPGCPGWPFPADEARKRQESAGPATRRTVDLGEGISLEMVLVPAGEFILGDPDGAPDERAAAPVSIGKAFWLGTCEVTNRQFRRFDPGHDSGTMDMHNKDQSVPGYPANLPDQPVIRISFGEAMAFCRWLSERTGARFTLPSESQWEWACRAGAGTPFWYGGLDGDFSRSANLADASLRSMAVGSGPYEDFIPKEARFNDGAMIECDVGRYEPNPWGLRDMHGNVWEWTRTAYAPYPYVDGDGRNAPAPQADRVVRGGSWRDRPKNARAASRLWYRPYQRVFNVGFRILCEIEG